MDHINLTDYSNEERLQIEHYLAMIRPPAASPSLAAPQARVTSSTTPPLASAPPIPPYRSIQSQRAEGLLSASTLPTRSLPSNIPNPSQHIIGQPTSSGFLGFQQMRRQVNQQRLESASSGSHGRTHLPRSQALQPRTSRRPPRSIRGASSHPPSLPSLRGIQRVYELNDAGQPSAIAIRAKVYPPIMRVSVFIILYIQLAEDPPGSWCRIWWTLRLPFLSREFQCRITESRASF